MHKLFEKEFISEYGSFIDENFEFLQKYLDVYTSISEGSAKFFKTSDDEHYFVVICSPIMQKVHNMVKQASDLVLVHASGGMDKQRLRTYVFVNPAAAGVCHWGLLSQTVKNNVFHKELGQLRAFLHVLFMAKKNHQYF